MKGAKGWIAEYIIAKSAQHPHLSAELHLKLGVLVVFIVCNKEPSVRPTPSSSLPFPTCLLAILTYPPTQDFWLLLHRLSLSPYLYVVRFQCCQLTVLRALIHGVKQKAIEIQQSRPNLVEHLGRRVGALQLRGPLP